MARSVSAGALYFAVVFVAGFVLGVARTIVVEPAIGPVAAVLVELPIVLTFAWLACGRILVRFRLSSNLGARLTMAVVAFHLLIAAEIGLAMIGGQTFAELLAGLATTAGSIGLTGQIIFGLVPVLRGAGRHPQERRRRRDARPVALKALWLAVTFQGITGLFGGVGMVLDPSGEAVGLSLSWLQGSYFRDYFVPGIVLSTLLGIGPLLVAVGLWERRTWARPASLLVGITLLVWIGVEVLVIGYRSDPPLQLFYGVLGGLITGLASRPAVLAARSDLVGGGSEAADRLDDC